MTGKETWFKKFNVNKESVQKALQKLNSRAKRITKNPQEAKKLLNQAQHKADQNQRMLKEVWKDLKLMFEMVSAWIKGDYREIPVRSVISIIGALIYFVSPVDLIPDFLAGIGLIDDAFVISFTIRRIQDDIHSYERWKNNSNEPKDGQTVTYEQ